VLIHSFCAIPDCLLEHSVRHAVASEAGGRNPVPSTLCSAFFSRRVSQMEIRRFAQSFIFCFFNLFNFFNFFNIFLFAVYGFF
jgi:hypothetical protein